MAQSLLIQAPDKGINASLPDNMIDNREANKFSKNVEFYDGHIITSSGFVVSTSNGLPLGSSSNAVLGLYQYKEHDGTEHILAVTSSTIYKKDVIMDTWDNIPINDIANNVLISTPFNPISFATVTHTDGISLDGTGSSAYQHVLICNGGLSPIQRWAGKFENKCYSLKGADGYHESDTPPVINHYAQQVNVFYEHVILLSPKTWLATPNTFVDNQSLIIFGKAGQLETSGTYNITQTGAGAIDLIDTGDSNVWCLRLGGQLIVYKTRSIWSLSHVGGTDIFRAKIEINGLGLLAPHLIVLWNNCHFFVGSDYNIYAYYGGSVKEVIGSQIRDLFVSQMDYTLAYKFQMAIVDDRLWIFYVPTGYQYAVKAWVMNLRTGAWQCRDFTHLWSSDGITTVNSVGSQSYLIGDTYQKATTEQTTYNDMSSTNYGAITSEILTKNSIVIGDNRGYVFQSDSDCTTDNNIVIPCQYITKVFDYNTPDIYKLWDGITLTAKGEILYVYYRLTDFDTETEGWRVFPAVYLTDEYTDYSFFFNETSKRIQFKFANYNAYVKLLLHFDTTANDAISSSHTVTLYHHACLSTSQSKFGGASLLLDGVDDYVCIDSSPDWNFEDEDFTIDFWVRFNALGSRMYFVSGRYNNYNMISYFIDSTNKLYFTSYNNAKPSGYFYTSTEYSFQTDTWYHIAFVRNGSNGIFFINGEKQPTITSTPFGSLPDLYGFGVNLHIGRYNGSGGLYYLNGYIDEFRIVKGAAEWIQSFSVPTRPYLYGGNFKIREYMIHSPTMESNI